MANKDKIHILGKISVKVDNATRVSVICYRSLAVKENRGVRRALTEAGAHMKVYKNNIVKIALKNAQLPEIKNLEGTCAYVFFEKDPVDAAKVIKKQSESLRKIEWVGGIADGNALSAEDARAYADLASREELMAQLVYVVASPLRGIVSVAAGPARGLVTALDALAEQKSAA